MRTSGLPSGLLTRRAGGAPFSGDQVEASAAVMPIGAGAVLEDRS